MLCQTHHPEFGSITPYLDRRLKIPHSAKVECGFRTTPEECLYDSGPIGPSV